MDPPPVPVASDTSATAIEMETPETIILQDPVYNFKLGLHLQEIQHLLDELHKSKDSATISDSMLLARQVAMAQMKGEFRSILFSIFPVKTSLASNPSSTYTDSEYSSYNSHEGTNINSEVPPKEVHYLQGIVGRMIAAGYSGECTEVYTSVRKTGVDEKFKKLLRIERMSSKNIQRLEWRVQQEKIQLWIQAAKICVRGLFAGERTLTNQIFNGLGTNIADDCFMKTVKDSAIQFFSFVDAISSSRKSPEKLFEILHLYEVLSDLLPDIETVFGSESCEFIRKQAVEILSSLSDAARGILSEFEKAVLGELTNVPTPRGSVHPLTKYVIAYIHEMVEHTQTLTQLIVSNPLSADYAHSRKLDFEITEFEGASPLVLHLVWIIVALKFNLQGKSRQYEGTPLAHLFMRNNVDYIVQEIKVSVELRKMIGIDYHNKLVSLAEANYRKSTWKRILDCFRCRGL